MKLPFQYSILRYTHDQVTQEFVNIGVLIFSPDMPFLDIQISTKYKRLSQLFNGIDRIAYERLSATVKKAVKRVADSLSQLSLLDKNEFALEVIIPKILPTNDAALSFDSIGNGVTENVEEELAYLFSRMVERYQPDAERARRTDEQVWATYAKLFHDRNILPHLTKVTLPTPIENYTFKHAFKNDRWHPIEPLSFDLSSKSYIEEKAMRWIGRAVTLGTTNEIDTLYILAGRPQKQELLEVYEAAKVGLEKNTAGINVEVIDENDVDQFSEQFKEMIESHQEH